MENNAGYVNDASFSFEGNPESFNVEQEVENTVGGLVYDPYRLSEVLVTIGEKMTGIPLYEYQRGLAFRIIYSILARDGAEITALFSRQSGKSEVIVFCVIVLGILLPVLAKIYPKELGYYSNGIKIGLFAPQGEQVQTVYQRCVARLHSEPVKMFLDDPDILDAPTSSVHFKLKSGTHVTGQSAAKQSKIESKTYNLVFIDECVSADTKVITQRGEIPISEVSIGDYVLSQGSNKRIWDEVTNHWSYGEREIFEVGFADGTRIRTTRNHRFYTNFGWLTLNEIMFYKLAGLTISSYLYDTQKLSYEKVNRTVNIRNTSGRWLHRLRRQKVFKESEVPSFERFGVNPTTGKGEQRLRKNELCVLNEVTPNNEEVPRYLLHELREKTRNKRVIINANIGGDSVLVYGRWKSNGKGKESGIFYPQFFVGREPIVAGNVGKIWFYECNTTNQKGVYLSNGGGEQKQILYGNKGVGDTRNDVQDIYFGNLEEVLNMQQRVYIEPQDCQNLLERVQRRSEKEILQLRRIQEVSKREENEIISRRCRVQTKGLREKSIVSVESKGTEKIYDISTKTTQSFFGNGVLIHNSQDVDTEKVRKCVSGDNLVMLPDGTEKTLKEVYENRLSIAGHEGIIYPKQFYHNGIQDVYRLTLTDGKYIDVTEEHKNKIIRRGKMDNKPFLVKTSELRVGDRLPVANEMPFFGNIGTYMDGLIIGYIMGDGYAKNDKVMFCGTKDVVNRLDYLVSKYGCKTYVNKFNSDNGLVEVSIIEDNISGVKRRGYKGTNGIINLLKSYDVYGHTGKDKRIPDRSYSADFLKGVIEALIETDGSVFISSNKPHINFTNTSKHLTDFVQKALHKFGVHGSILEKKNNGELGKNPNNLHSFTIKDSRSIITFNHYFTLFSKQDKLRKCFDLALTKKSRNTCNYYPDSERYYKIVSIENIGKKDTYCIESDRDDHLWVVNGIITHNSIIPMTASTFGTVVRTGTPGRNKGDFYYVIQNNKKDDKKLTSPKQKLKFQKHFEFNYKDVIRYKREQYKKDGKDFHLLYEKAVLRDKKSSGENSDYFRMSYRIEWLLDVGMFITEERLNEKVYNKKIIFPKTSPTDFVVAGLDIASARANTVLTTALLDTVVKEFGERPIKTLTSWTVLNDLNYEEQFHIIANSLLEHNVKVLYSDYTGVGRALTDILMYHLGELIEIIPYTFTPSSKSDMWKALDEDIENGRLIVPAHRTVRETSEFKMFDEQMLNLQKYWKGSFMICEKTQGFKDDFCDSLGMCNLAGNHLYTPSTSVEITSNNLLGTGYRNNLRNNSRW